MNTLSVRVDTTLTRLFVVLGKRKAIRDGERGMRRAPVRVRGAGSTPAPYWCKSLCRTALEIPRGHLG